MEHLVLKTLKFDLSVPTILNFLERYLAAAKAPAGGSKLESLSKVTLLFSIVRTIICLANTLSKACCVTLIRVAGH